MNTPTQTPRKKQRNLRSSSTTLKRTANLLHHESKSIVSESSSSSMMISPVTEQIEVTSPTIESSIGPVEILDSYLLVSPTREGLQNLVFPSDSSLSPSSEITNYTANSSPDKSDVSEMSAATGLFKLQNLEFADDSAVSDSSEVINNNVNVSPNESAPSEASSDPKKKTENKDVETMRMIELLKRSELDSNGLNSLIKIGSTNLEDEFSKPMWVKARLAFFYFAIWIGLVLVILFWKSSSIGVSSSTSLTPPPT